MQIKDKYFYFLQPLFHFALLGYLFILYLTQEYVNIPFELLYGFLFLIVILLTLCTYISMKQYSKENKIIYIVPKNTLSILLLFLEVISIWIASRMLGIVISSLLFLTLAVVMILEYKDVDNERLVGDSYAIAARTILRGTVLFLITGFAGIIFIYFAFATFGFPGGV